MKNMFFVAALICLMLAMSGCGDGGDSPPLFEAQIFSDPEADGHIKYDPPNSFTVTQGPLPNVLAGIHPVTGSEYRAFLTFPLTGEVPGNAFIKSATLYIFIDRIAILTSANLIPIRIELVSFSPLSLSASDYDRITPPLVFTTIEPPISSADVQNFVSVDVTSLMEEAQRRGLANFQVRILEDFGFVYPGLIGINDTNALAPLLVVTYY